SYRYWEPGPSAIQYPAQLPAPVSGQAQSPRFYPVMALWVVQTVAHMRLHQRGYTLKAQTHPALFPDLLCARMYKSGWHYKYWRSALVSDPTHPELRHKPVLFPGRSAPAYLTMYITTWQP